MALLIIMAALLLLIVFFGAFAVAWLFHQYGDEHERERERQKKGGAK